MTIDALRDTLGRAGVMVQLDGERLHVIAPVGKLTPDLGDELRTHKPALVALLKRQRTGPPFLPTSMCGSRTICEVLRLLHPAWSMSARCLARPKANSMKQRAADKDGPADGGALIPTECP